MNADARAGYRTFPPEPLPDSPDPIEIAMDLEHGDPAPDSPARRLLIDQGRLVRSQIMSERMGALLKVLTGLAGLLAVGVLAIMAWQASKTDQLILQPFSVPPDLAQRGMTGEVVATRLRDALASMQANRISTRAPSSYADDWTETPEIEIPQTGVSVSELQLAFRNWLGRETRISGEVVRTATGYQVTARAGGEPGEAFAGTEAELDATIGRAAEAVYRMTQPDRYAGWLAEEGKKDEAAKLYKALSIRGTREARAWVLAEWAGLESDPAARLAQARRAQLLDPDHPVAAVHVSQSLKELGQSSEALPAYRRSAALLTGARADELAPWWASLYAKEHAAEAAALLGDFGEAARLNDLASEPTPDQPPLACSNCSSYAALMSGRDRARSHDAAGAWAETERAATIFPEAGQGFRMYAGLLMAHAAEDWPATLAWADRTGAGRSEAEQTRYDKWLVGIYKQSLGQFAVASMQAEALAHTGRVPEARALLARAPAGALEAFRAARQRGPRWADPLKGEGDALARLGRHRDAVRAFAQAAERAPRWPGLHLAWSHSLSRLGRLPEARARRATGMRLAAASARAMALAAATPPPPATR